MARISLPYHRKQLEVEVPDHLLQGILNSRVNQYDAGATEKEIIKKALDSPSAGPSLESLVRGKQSMVIVTSDHTRPLPSQITLPILLKRIRRAEPGIAVTILVGTGFHRGTTQEELVEKFGAEIAKNEKIIIHDSRDDRSMIRMGILPSGGEFWLNRLAVETDLLIAE